MSTWAVLATGPSMSHAVANRLRGRCKVVAVSDSIRLAPWADVLVSGDRAWWDAHPEALEFQGLKFGSMPKFQSVAGVERFNAPSGTNSGLLALMVAVSLGAKKVLLYGVDLHSPGTHFFGKHGGLLKSTTTERMDVFKNQFAKYQPVGVEVLNCAPGSALRAYRMGDLEAIYG